MVRIFTTLAAFAMLSMAAALVLGFYVTGVDAARNEDLRPWFRVHFLLGVFAALAVVLVSSIAMTYFIGTSRWCKEVVEAYKLDAELVHRSTTIKRRAFPWALSSMLAIVGLVALGAAADTRPPDADHWVTIHLVTALSGIAFIAWAFYSLGQRIAAHHAVIEDIVAEVRRIRLERGLPV